MSALSQWALVSAVKGIINDSEKEGKVNGLVEETDRVLKAFFPEDEKVLKRLIVERVIIPYVKLLLKDDVEWFGKLKVNL